MTIPDEYLSSSWNRPSPSFAFLLKSYGSIFPLRLLPFFPSSSFFVLPLVFLLVFTLLAFSFVFLSLHVLHVAILRSSKFRIHPSNHRVSSLLKFTTLSIGEKRIILSQEQGFGQIKDVWNIRCFVIHRTSDWLFLFLYTRLYSSFSLGLLVHPSSHQASSLLKFMVLLNVERREATSKRKLGPTNYPLSLYSTLLISEWPTSSCESDPSFEYAFVLRSLNTFSDIDGLRCCDQRWRNVD